MSQMVDSQYGLVVTTTAKYSMSTWTSSCLTGSMSSIKVMDGTSISDCDPSQPLHVCSPLTFNKAFIKGELGSNSVVDSRFHFDSDDATDDGGRSGLSPTEGSWMSGEAVALRLWTKLPSSFSAHTITCWLAETSPAPVLFSPVRSFTTASDRAKNRQQEQKYEVFVGTTWRDKNDMWLNHNVCSTNG